MAENNENEPPILEPSVERGDFEDNESNNSFEFENAQDMSHMESELKQHMTEIATQVKNSITDMSNHMQQQFSDVSSRIERLESQVHENSKNITGEGSHRITSLDSINVNDNNKQPIPTSVLHIPEPMAETTVLEHSATSETTNNNIFPRTATAVQDPVPRSVSATHYQLPSCTNDVRNTNSAPNSAGHGEGRKVVSDFNLARGDNSVKLKPQCFSGTPADDFEDYLAQFNITTEINGWNYKQKSLYLANSLTGNARSLLSELTEEQRKDYDTLVQKLTVRYGSQHRAEVYRAQLKSKVKGKTESIVELAQSIRKLSRQAYPNASLEMIEVLALDHFIDSLVDTDIRLRIREVGPKSLSEAETMAVRLEAHRIADRQRSRLVGKIEQQVDHDDQENVSNMVSSLDRNVDHLQKRVDDLCKDKNPPSYNNWNGNSQHQNGRQYNNHRNDYRGPSNNQRNQGRQNNYRGNQQYRNNYHNNHNQHNHQSYNNRYQSENCHQPNQGFGSRLN